MSKNKTLKREELEKILQEHDISFSDIAKIAQTIKEENDKEDIVSKNETSILKKAVKPTIMYKLTKTSYPDFVVTKTTATQVKELVVAPSCDGLFIRTLKKNGDWEIEQLTGEKYSSFMSDFKAENPIVLPDEFYIKKLERGKTFGDALISYLSDETIKQMIKDKCAPKFEAKQITGVGWYSSDCANIERQKEIYKIFPVIYKEYACSKIEKISKIIKGDPGLVMFVYRVYGVEKTRDFIEHLNLCLYDFNGNRSPYASRHYTKSDYEDQDVYDKVCKNKDGSNSLVFRYLDDNLPLINMDYESFKEYLLYESYRLGYSNIGTFTNIWNDTLSMENRFFGKIKEKYPKDLPIYHNKLCRRNFNYKYYETPGFDNNFSQKSKENEKFAWKPQDGEYEYIVPFVVGDVVSEAEQQSNCLVNANYMQRVIDGTSVLVFMRKKEDLDHSFVTMEIVEDRINQAFLASNKIPDTKIKKAILKYAEHFNLQYNA